MKSEKQLNKAMYGEWQASLWGACIIAFGLGTLLYRYFPQTLVYIAILIGIALHSWGMYRIHSRNK